MGNKDELANIEYMLENTKPCPKCNSPTQKESGCNHMTCRNCKLHWCWLCNKLYDKDDARVGYMHNCRENEWLWKNNEGEKQLDVDYDYNEMETQLPRFEQFYERLVEITSSLKLEQLLIGEIAAYTDTVASVGLSRFDIEDVVKASKTLCQARRIEKYATLQLFYQNPNLLDVIGLNLFQEAMKTLPEKADALSRLLSEFIQSDPKTGPPTPQQLYERVRSKKSEIQTLKDAIDRQCRHICGHCLAI